MVKRFTDAERVAFRQALPRKRQVASLAAFHRDRLLLVKPTYREGWLLPGGVVEYGESPAACCIRESEEELGLRLPMRRLLLVDYASDPGDGSGESIHFWFGTDPLSAVQVEDIRLPEDELEAFHLAHPDEAREMLIPRMAARLEVALTVLDSDRTAFSEDGNGNLVQ